MLDLKKHLPNAHFGKANHEKMDWTKHEDHTPDNDEELTETPNEVKRMLGFDPKKVKSVPKKKGK